MIPGKKYRVRYNLNLGRGDRTWEFVGQFLNEHGRDSIFSLRPVGGTSTIQTDSITSIEEVDATIPSTYARRMPKSLTDNIKTVSGLPPDLSTNTNDYTDSEIESALTEWFELSKKDGEEVNSTAIKNMVRFIKTHIKVMREK